MPKVKFYKKYGAITSKSAKAGLAPGGLHGVRCMGVPLTRLKAFGTTIGRCLPGKHAGRSVNWWLAGHQCDPIHPCRVEPIAAWAEPVWDEQLDDADLRKAWRRQQRLVGLKNPSWSEVSGPISASIMDLRQLGLTGRTTRPSSLRVDTRWMHPSVVGNSFGRKLFNDERRVDKLDGQ